MRSSYNRFVLWGALIGLVVFGLIGTAHGQVPSSNPVYPVTMPMGAGSQPFINVAPTPGVMPGESSSVSLPDSPPILPGLPHQPVLPTAEVVVPVPPAPGLAQPIPMVQPGGAGTTGASNAGTAPASTPPSDPDKPKFDLNWNSGLFIQTADKRLSFHFGATAQYDFVWYSASPILEMGRLGNDGVGKFHDAANLRRGRIFFEGTLYEAVDYKFELEFFNGIGFSPAGTTNPTIAGSITNSPGPTDAWMTIKDVPFLGNIRIGSQKEWFSLEHLNSYRNLEFMERSFLFDFAQATAFNNGFSPGISVFRTWLDDRVFSGIGMYKNESDLIGFGLGDGQYAVTGRIAALPIWMPDDKIFWSVGGAMSHRDPVDDRVQVRIRSNIRNAPFPLLPLLANTGSLDSSSQDLFNFETAAVWGSMSLQAEYSANVIRGARVAPTLTTPAGPPLGDLFFQGAYAQALIFLTGESRTWNNKQFYFNRVVPKRPFRLKRNDCDECGWGAWEVGARYSYLDMTNQSLQVARLDSVTLGLNWYLNSNAKIQWNYDYAHRGDTPNAAQGHVHALGIRSQFDF